MLESNDIIQVDQVASLLKKSESWCYQHASLLGAAKIGGSWFFRLSTLEKVLEEAVSKQQGNGSGAGRPETVRRQRKKKPRSSPHPATDPEKYGLADLMFAFAQGGGAGEESGDIFLDIDALQALEALRKR